MWNPAYTQKRIFYAYIKTLQIKLLVSSAAKKYLTSSIPPLGNGVFHCQ